MPGAVEEEGPGGPGGPGGVRALRCGPEPLGWRVVRGSRAAFACHLGFKSRSTQTTCLVIYSDFKCELPH